MDGLIASRERERMFIEWLDRAAEDAEAIFLLGDVFDFWFEWRRVIPKGFSRLLGKFSELTDRGVKIHFFVGNHDMWAYDYLHTECGLILHHKPEVFDLGGRRVFLAHGDSMYVRKPRFMERFMHGCFRSRFMRWVFGSLLHPDTVMRFGQWWSAKSRKSHDDSHNFKGEGEYLVQYARAYQKCMNKLSVDYFVFGHIHCATQHDLGDGRAVFLGEWLNHPTYAVLDNDGQMELSQL